MSQVTQEQVIQLLREGLSYCEFANRLKRSKSCVGRLSKSIDDIGSGTKEARPSKLYP